MNRLTDLQHDVKNVQDTVLTDLDADERVRMFLKAAAEGQEDRIEMLRDSVPRYEYEMRDLEFTEGTKEVYMLSMLANHALERLYITTLSYEAGRDKHIALVLLNEALERLSQGHFTVDEDGTADAPESWPHPYPWMDNTDASRLAGKYGELWEENDIPLPPSFEKRESPYFAELATESLLGYDYGDGWRESNSIILQSDDNLMQTVVEFYVAFHTFRRLAEEHLDTTLDELLQATQAERSVLNASLVRVDEEACRDLLERKAYYLTAYEEGMKDLVGAVKEANTDALEGVDTEDVEAFASALSDLDAEVDEAVEEMAAQFDYAI